MPKEQLVNIPSGHHNNIWWNIAHVVVTQQLLVYKLSGLPLRIPERLVLKYKKGTVPDGMATDAEIAEIKELLVSTIEWTLQDHEKGLFERYTAFNTSVAITLGNVEEAMAFNVYHEGLHLGVIQSLEKAL